MLKIIEANSKKEFLDAKEATLKYIEWLGIDLAFQNIDKELKEFEYIYSKKGGGIFLVAYYNNKLAGSVGFKRLSNDICEMKRLFVFNEFRGFNIGYELCLNLILKAKKQGYKKIRLDTLNYMKSAIKLYKKLGFKEIKPYYYNPHPNTFFMELELNIQPFT